MQWQDADDSHAGGRNPTSGNGQLHGPHTRSGDDRGTVEHAVQAFGRQQTREALGVIGSGFPAEVVADDRQRLAVLVEIAGRANAERQQAILCASASSPHREQWLEPKPLLVGRPVAVRSREVRS